MMTVSDKKILKYESAIDSLLSVNLGAQRFKESWLVDLQVYFSGIKYSSTILKEIKKSKSHIVLLLIKNRTGLVSQFLTERQVSEYRARYLKRLAEMNCFVIVKPHPGSKNYILRKELSQVATLKYEISELPVAYLASVSSFGVAEFPTNSIYDVFSCKKNVFWPCEFLDDSGCINLANTMIEKGFPEDFYSHVRFGLPVGPNVKYMGPNVSKIIDTKVEISDVDNYIEGVMI
jgi:hypothetical protein